MSDAFRPVTTSRSLQTPQGYRIYTTTRQVAMEFPLPVVGDLLSASNFIAGFTNHYIMDVNEVPNGDLKKVTITHGPVPSGTYEEYESMAYTFPAIYPFSTTPEFFPGGSRQRGRVVPARVQYEYRLSPTTPAPNWLTAATIWNYSDPTTGPFEVLSYMQEAAGSYFEADDGTGGLVGDFLNSMFIGQDTINDEIAISAPGDLAYTIDPSLPSKTTYATWVAGNTEIMASRTLFKFYCFYARRTVWVRAQ
jgi:hypothetical protein